VNVEFRTRFAEDLSRIKDARLLARIREVIERVDQARTLRDIPNIEKLKGGASYYRIRIGNHRLGLSLLEGTVIFVRCLDRSEIYRYFP
jgi:mRNA interferase RelE/StbE